MIKIINNKNREINLIHNTVYFKKSKNENKQNKQNKDNKDKNKIWKGKLKIMKY